MESPEKDETASSPGTEEISRSIPGNRRRLRRWAVVGATLIAAWLAVSFLVAYKLTGRRRPPYPEPPPKVAWAQFESLRLRTIDGEEIGAWFAEGRENAPSVLFLHGNGGGRGHCLSRAEMTTEDLGCTTMLISLRAHGDSTGEFNDIGLSARHDVVAAVDFLEQRRPRHPIVIVGVSLGSAAATFAADELGDRVAGYILESPYSDLETAVRNRTRAALPPPFEPIAYLGLRIAALVILPQLDAIAPMNAVANAPLDVPILILAGEADQLATPAEARAIQEHARMNARLEMFPKASHNNLVESDPSRYRRLLIDFIAEAARGR